LHADFDLSSFDYHADYLVDEGRVQMSLESKKSQIVNIKGLNIRICFAEGENVHVENSVKYSTSEIEQLAKKSGLVVEKTFFDKDIKFSLSLLTQSSNDIINKRIAELERCWKYSDDFFELLHPSAWLKRPIALRLPFLFYLGHLPAFAHNQICGPHLYASETRKSFNSVFDDIFSRGIDPDVEEPTICHSHPDYPDSWPSIGQILDYRSRVRDIVLSCLPDIIRSSSNLDKELSGDGRVASMVAEHEYMHSETLLYMYHGLEAKFKRISSRLRKNYIFGKSRVEPVDKSILIPDGQVTVGAEIDRLEFGWDNEFPSHVVHVPAFRIDKFAVTNARFLEFVLEKGYSTRSFWDPADWEWLQEHSIVKPLSWQIDPAASTLDVSSIKIETVFGDLIDFDDALEWPVWVSLAEARAFCKWSGKRLPTEEEYLRAAYGRAQVDSENDFPWGNEQPKPSLHGNFGLSSWSPTPVGTYPKGESSFGVDELVLSRSSSFLIEIDWQRLGMDKFHLRWILRISSLYRKLSRVLGRFL
jgi:formylglycine-generating enzyme required for sulfatase activity